MNALQNLFTAILNMSITASYVAIGVIFIRLLFKKVPKVFSYILWAPVLFRLVCPLSFASIFSFLRLTNLNVEQGKGVVEFVPQNIGLMPTPAIQSGIDSIDNAVNASLPQAIPYASVNPMQIWMAFLSLIWISGVIALLIYSIVSYVKIKGRLQTATLVEGNVFETDTIGTAFVCGFIPPQIYVPVNIGDANLSYILEHERTHIRRRDYLIKPLAFLALILHWFNPLMWLSFALMSRDMEMSCDESVLRKLGDDAKGGYSGSLLSLSVKRKGSLTVNPLAFGESHVKARIKNVLNYKKSAFWVVIIAVVAVCTAVIAFAANPADSAKDSATFISEDYQISLKYPPHWELNPKHKTRYEGIDGFLQISAINGESMSIDQVAELDAFHMLMPYGSSPQIKGLEIQGQKARLILPSDDQPEVMSGQAGLIVEYPKEVKIKDSKYYYLVLWADKAHIEKIGGKISFLKEQWQGENSINNTQGAPTESTSSVEPSTEPPEKSAAEILSDLANQEFSIKEDQISDDDYETIVIFGKAFVNLYTGAVAEQETVSFENYISNKNLLKFTNKMLELTQKQELHGRNVVNYGLENEFKKAECKKLDENLCYLKIPFQFQGSGMSCELLVQSENKSLKIVDLYFGNKDGVDTIATGHSANRKVDNPKLWDDEEWVLSVFEKLQKYESDLNS